jgi:hypothetical protein
VKTNYTTDGQNKAHHYRRRRKRLKKWRKSGRPAAAATPNNKFRQGLFALQVNVPATQSEGSSAVKAKNQGASSNNKTYVHKNKNQGQGKTKKYHGKGKEKSFDSGRVRFDQDKGKAGSRYQGSSSFKKSYNPPSRTSGPQHPGGSLEDLLTGGYKGRKFDPAKSRKYKELQAYFTRHNVSTAGAAASTSGNGANAAGQATQCLAQSKGTTRAIPSLFTSELVLPKKSK